MSWSDDLPSYVRKCVAGGSTEARDEGAVLELVRRARGGEAKAADALVRRFMEYALSVARVMESDFSHRVPMEDFLQAALEGLLATIRSRFDPSRGAKFTTAAWFWMRKYCFELAAELGYPVRKPRGAAIGAVSLETPGGEDRLAVVKVIPSEHIGPESMIVIATSWKVILLALTEAIDALEESQRAAVIRRRLADAAILPLLDAPDSRLHRITLWKNERRALARLREMLSEAFPDDDALAALRLIDKCRHQNGFDDSLENACAF